MKRFYKDVAVVARDGRFAVELDARPVRTPRRNLLALSSRALAEAIAEEWRRQDDEVVPTSMPMLRLANTALDVIGAQRDAVIDNIAGYGGSDLVCYWADGPEALVARQRLTWQPLLDWLEQRFSVRLRCTGGLAPVEQDVAHLAALRQAVAAFDDMELAVANDLTTISGSLVIALAVLHGKLDVEQAWTAAHVDEAFQAERWGEDHEAAARAARLQGELREAGRFLGLHRNG